MQITLIAPVNNLLGETVAFDGLFKIGLEKSEIRQFLASKEALHRYGSLDIEMLQKNTCIYFEGDSEQLSFLAKKNDHSSLSDNTHRLWALLTSFFWFIKDNSIFCDVCFGASEKRWNKNFREHWKSNSKGEFEITTFSQAELDDLDQILPALINLYIDTLPREENISRIKKNGEVSINKAPLDSIPYNSHTRVLRSLLFVDVARNNHFILMKILFYVGAIESLFGSKTCQGKECISKATTDFISQSDQEKNEDYSLVFRAYDIRSKYVHGQELKANVIWDDLPEVSQKMDSLLRRVLWKQLLNIDIL